MTNWKKDTYLHQLSHHTNYTIPVSNYLTTDRYPGQASNKINSMMSLKFHDRRIADQEDSQLYRENIEDEHTVYTRVFRILRYDLHPPYYVIAITEDGKYLTVGDSRCTDTQVTVYPWQQSKFIGMRVQNLYPESKDWNEAYILRCDHSEPCYTVMMEVLPEINRVRFVLGDECMTKIDKDAWVAREEKSDSEIASIRLNIIGGKKFYV